MEWTIVFAFIVFICAAAYGLFADVKNGAKDYSFQSGMPVFILMLVFSVLVGVIVSKGTSDKDYKRGQVDFQNGIVKYKVEIKNVNKNDTVISEVKDSILK